MDETGDNLDVLAEHAFSIALVDDAQNKCVSISDGKGRKGGQARGRNVSNENAAFTIQWRNGTGSPCRLSFFEWTVERDGNPVEVPVWPFTREVNGYEQPNLLNIASGQQRTVQLLSVNQRKLIKYEVLVGADADQPVATLDPMIVIER